MSKSRPSIANKHASPGKPQSKRKENLDKNEKNVLFSSSMPVVSINPLGGLKPEPLAQENIPKKSIKNIKADVLKGDETLAETILKGVEEANLPNLLGKVPLVQYGRKSSVTNDNLIDKFVLSDDMILNDIIQDHDIDKNDLSSQSSELNLHFEIKEKNQENN
jgi:hypothetical protein